MSSSTTGVDRPSSPATDIALVAVFAGLTAVFALAPAIPVGGVGVPITLQNLAVALCGMILGPRRGFLAVLLYLLVGFAGLPVFAGGAGGLGVFAKPSIGYLLSFPIGAAVTGWLSYRFLRQGKGSWWMLAIAGLVATVLVIHPLGILGMSMVAKIDLAKAVMLDLPFWPGDILKQLVAGFIAAQVHRAFPTLAGRR